MLASSTASESSSRGKQRSETHGQTPTEFYAYAAGYFDGEGCFTYRSSPIIEAVSVYPFTLEEIAINLGGKVFKRVPRAKQRVYYQYRIYGGPALELVKKILPYLREKRVQALQLFRIRELPPGPEREKLKAELKAMKQVEYK